MRFPDSLKYIIGVSAAVALLAGCSGGGSQLGSSGTAVVPNLHKTVSGNHRVDLSQTLVTPPNVKAQFHKVPRVQAVKPNCCAYAKTLFVTDAFGGPSYTGAVYMFDFKTGALLGSVPTPPEGFLEVQGACVDKGGNVYVANTALSTIDEYSHSGAYVATLDDPNEYPVGCAYDRSTGNLAVSNIVDTSGGPGSISIYSGGVLQNTYYPPNMSRVYFIGYEGGTGTLWLDGSDSSGFFQYDSFSGGTFTPVAITGGSIAFPGMVQWSAKTKSMNVGDQDTFSAPTFYQVSDAGAITGATVTNCAQASDFCDIVQGTIKGSGIIGPDAILLQANKFPYPAGGASMLTYSAPFIEPLGSAVSPDVP
jgi:hypothetical protein